ncbi:MAG: hypothetical protein M3Y05_15405, partial [Gemmatimonadota bacterium]|nr:hypothetical protein [Gemmatimonadota bacterium]
MTITIPPRAAATQLDTGSHEPSAMHFINDWDGHNQGAWRTSDGKPMHQTFAYDSELRDTVM